MQSAKLLTSVREIFLNDEHDVEFSNSVYEQYLQNITEVEKGLVELRLKKDVAKGKEKKTIAESIKKAEESVEAMKVARKNMLKYNSSFAEGLQVQRYIALRNGVDNNTEIEVRTWQRRITEKIFCFLMTADL